MSFLYPPLQAARCIRLLRFQGLGEDEKTVQFSLESTPQQVPPAIIGEAQDGRRDGHDDVQLQYHALSYVWGDCSIKQHILCNGIRVAITKNLHDALTQLTSQFPDRLLWVDSLCINQDDLDEKAVHVAMMGDVYASAKNVICWLGLADGIPSHPYQATINEFQAIRSRYPPHEKVPACKKCQWTLFENKFECKNDIHQATAESCPGLRELAMTMAKSPWFSRVWTFQELIRASSATIHLGPYYFDSWEYFAHAHSEFNRSHGCVIAAVSNIEKLNAFREGYNQRRRKSLAGAITAIKDRQASVLHDKVFAAMGLSSRVQSSNFKVDYTLTIEQLYTALTRFSVLEDANPGVLISVPYDDDKDPERCSDMPSWAVDWASDWVMSGCEHINVGSLPHLASTESSLGLYCLVLGYIPSSDTHYLQRNHGDAPTFQPIPPCVTSSTLPKADCSGEGESLSNWKTISTRRRNPSPPQLTVSKPSWVGNSNYLIAHLDDVEKIPDSYIEPLHLSQGLTAHRLGQCSCPTKGKPMHSSDEPARWVSLLVNPQGWVAANYFVITQPSETTFALAGEYNWDARWPDGHYWIPEKRLRQRGTTKHRFPLILSAITLS